MGGRRAIIGARVVHVIANISFYANNPGDIFAIWHGGLSSFGGLLFAVPVAIVLARRRCPELPTSRALDLVAPVLAAAWGVGRLLGPQLMVNGGGHPTNAWYGLEYAGQVGKRIPVPVFQSLECFAILGILLLVERWTRAGRPVGMITALAVALWSLTRFTDEFFWLAVPRLWDAVEVVSLILSACGFVAVAVLWRRHRRPGCRAPRRRRRRAGPQPRGVRRHLIAIQPSGANWPGRRPGPGGPAKAWASCIHSRARSPSATTSVSSTCRRWVTTRQNPRADPRTASCANLPPPRSTARPMVPGARR